MDNHDEVLDALTAFGKTPNPQEIPSILEQYLNCVAKNGETLFPWSQLKPLILRKMELVISELRATLAAETIPTRPNVENVRFDVIHARIIDSLHKFNGAPFTIQRLCELLIEPKRHYKRSDKFMRGLEKNVLVVSTVDPFGRKVVCESGSKPMVNGIPDVNGSSYPSRDSGLSIPLPPVPGWVTTSSVNRKTVVAAAAVADAGPQEAKIETATAMQVDSQESDVVPNGVSAGGMAVTSSEFGDQEDPLAVQAEEVVEETVVTMDTSEVSSVVTDGGEAMAEGGEAGGGGAMTEDREASSSLSSSSSSSSSEELSTSSDSVERASPFGGSVHSFNDEAGMDATRPWAAFSHDAKQPEDAATSRPPPSTTNPPAGESLPEENQSCSEALSSVPPSKSPEASSSVSSSSSSLSPAKETAASSSTTTTTTTAPSSQKGPEGKDKTEDCCGVTQTSSDDKMESEDVSSGIEHEELSSSSIEPEVKSASCDEINQPPVESANATLSAGASSTTSSSSSSSYSEPIPDSQQAPSSSLDVRTYAQVAASSSTDAPTLGIHLEPTGEDSVPCDSVAGLERLVGSVEQSLASSSSSSSSSSLSASSPPRLSEPSPSLPSSSQPTTTTSPTSVVNSSTPGTGVGGCSRRTAPNVPSSTDYDSPDGEPISKRPRLSTSEEDDNDPQHHRMEEEEDRISTSSDSCMDHEQAHTDNDDNSQQRATIDSSSVTGDDDDGRPQIPASEVEENEEMSQAEAEGGSDNNKGPGQEEVMGSDGAGSSSDKACPSTSGEGVTNTSSSGEHDGAKSSESESMMEVGGGDTTDGEETPMVSSMGEEPSAMSLSLTTAGSTEDQQPVP